MRRVAGASSQGCRGAQGAAGAAWRAWEALASRAGLLASRAGLLEARARRASSMVPAIATTTTSPAREPPMRCTQSAACVVPGIHLHEAAPPMSPHGIQRNVQH